MITPTGSSMGAKAMRATTSTQTRKMAPTSTATGSARRWSVPTSMRTMWGMTRPTKPMAPETATMMPVSSEHEEEGDAEAADIDAQRLGGIVADEQGVEGAAG